MFCNFDELSCYVCDDGRQHIYYRIAGDWFVSGTTRFAGTFHLQQVHDPQLLAQLERALDTWEKGELP